MAGDGLQAFAVFGDVSLKGGDSVKRELNDVTGHAKNMGGGFTSALSTVGMVVGVVAVAVAAAATGFVYLAKVGEESLIADNRLRQIATSMRLFGNNVGSVTDRLLAYADTQARSLGIDDDVIKATQAKLMTFGQLAKTAGEVGGSFDRATDAAVDMAAAGFGQAEQNAVQLGKALQDPIKGVTALAKSGITFTAQEKEKIKTLVESGHMLDAQNMVLAAIEKQVSGTAKATATGSARMKVAFDEATESVGLKLLPAYNALADTVVDTVLPAIEDLIAGIEVSFDGAKVAWDQYVTGFTMPNIITTNPFAQIGAFLREAYEVVKGVLGPMVEVFKKSWADMQKDMGPALKELSKGFEQMKPMLTAIAQLLGGVLAVAIGLVVGVLNGLVRMIAPLVQAFGGLMEIVGGVSNGMHALFGGDWSGFVDGMKAAIDGVVNLFAGLYGAVAGFVKGFVEGIVNFFMSLYDSLVGNSIIPDMINGIVEWFAGLPGKVMAFVSGLVASAIAAVIAWKDTFIANVQALAAGVSAAWTALQTWLAQLWKTILAAFVAWGGLLLAGAIAAWAAIDTAIRTAWTAITTATTNVWNALKALLSAAWESIKTTALAALTTLGTWVLEKWTAIKATTTAVWTAVSSAISSAWEAIKTGVSSALATVAGYISDRWAAIKSATSAAWAAVDAAIDAAWASIKSSASAALSAVLGYVNDKWSAAKSATSSAWAAIKAALSAAWSSMKTAVSAGITAVVGYVQGIRGKVTSALGNMSSLLTGAGKSILSGLLNGMKSAWSAAASWLSSLGSKIKSLKGPLDYDAQLLTDQGAAIIDGLGRGMQSAWPGIASTLAGYTSEIGGMSMTLPTAQSVSATGLGIGGPLGASGSLVLNLAIDLGDRIVEVSRTITEGDVRDGTYQARLVPLGG